MQRSNESLSEIAGALGATELTQLQGSALGTVLCSVLGEKSDLSRSHTCHLQSADEIDERGLEH